MLNKGDKIQKKFNLSFTVGKYPNSVEVAQKALKEEPFALILNILIQCCGSKSIGI